MGAALAEEGDGHGGGYVQAGTFGIIWDAGGQQPLHRLLLAGADGHPVGGQGGHEAADRRERPACLAQSRIDACRATWSGLMAIGTA